LITGTATIQEIESVTTTTSALMTTSIGPEVDPALPWKPETLNILGYSLHLARRIIILGTPR
jgi:hypothetical protein